MIELTCIIVEDESIHSDRLQKLIKESDSRIKIEDVCKTIDEAYDKILQKKPQLLFLDIQLEGNERGGFTLLKRIGEPFFEVVFTTAYIDNNIQEIRQCGVDFLAKPYIAEELNDSLLKVWQKQSANIGIQQLGSLLRNLVTDNIEEQQVWLKSDNGYVPVQVKNLIYAKAKNQYTSMFVKKEDGKVVEVLTSKGLSEWEKTLSLLHFLRIHDSYIVNARHIVKVDLKNASLSLKNSSLALPVSRTGKEKLRKFMDRPIFPM